MSKAKLKDNPLVNHDNSVTTEQLDGIARDKPSWQNRLGRPKFNLNDLTVFNAKPLESKREVLKKQWADITYMLLGKAKSNVLTLSKKDYGRLCQIITSAAISFDKVFPKGEVPSVGNLVVNLFRSLPSDQVLRVIGAAPTPRVQAVVEDTSGLPLTVHKVEHTPSDD